MNEPKMSLGHKEITVFALLEYGRGISRWRERYSLGLVTDPFPYSYHLAQNMGCDVTFSDDVRENSTTRFVRKVLARVLGFDLLQVYRHRKLIRESDIVWMHTEQVHLGYTLLSKFMNFPPALCNSVWIADEYPRKGILIRQLWRLILRGSSVNITESVECADYISKFITGKSADVVRYGIDGSHFATNISRPRSPLTRNLVAVGNDRHRDWKMLFEIAIILGPNYNFRVLTRIPAHKLPKAPENVRIIEADNIAEIVSTYAWADIACLPLQHNLHASGVTVVMEAAGASLPVLTTLVGGINDYFPNLSTFMVDIDDGPQEWAFRIRELLQNEDVLNLMRKAVIDDINTNELTAVGYVERLVARSRIVL